MKYELTLASVPRRFRVVSLILIVMLFSGCVEFFQYVGQDEHGRLITSFSVRIQKLIFAMAAGLSGEETPDFGEILGIDEEEMVRMYSNGSEIQYEIIDTELEFGFRISLTLDADSQTVFGDVPFLPNLSEGMTTITLGGSGSADGQDGMAIAFLSSSKYRLLISKAYVPSISSAWYEVDGRSIPVEYRDYQSVYFIEFPIVYMLASGEDGKLRIEH